ncbi:P-loop containing nucleoside triphosphate hydrolase protein [Spinellus fusiger]|nr:P-loop containing nucleoside triphosphate hydrolase protein [Spinellus fusiger]
MSPSYSSYHNSFLPYATAKAIVAFEHAHIYRTGSKEPVFKDLSLTIAPHERLVITGPVNAGKTTLAKALAGQLLVSPPSAAQWPCLPKTGHTQQHISLVSFREDSSMFSYGKHYYQERFNFSDPDNEVTLLTYLQGHNHVPKDKIAHIAKALDLSALLPLSFIKLSNGQTRRARIARALLKEPHLLILDEPLMGLDIQHRQKLLNVMGEMTTAPKGIPVVLVQRPQDDMPTWATHVISLNAMTIAWRGSPKDYLSMHHAHTAQQQAEKNAFRQHHLRLQASQKTQPPIIELKNIQVTYAKRRVLDAITWTVRQGERWALLGPNGSGKTTLLSLITGDHPQAYSNELYLFGRRRGTGESIWSIKQRIGVSSPEIHLYFNQRMTALEAAGTGFFDGVVARTLSKEQQATVHRLLDEFGVSESAHHRPLQDMSTGEQRLVLLVRSLTLILVTHHEEEIPRAVTKRFQLGPGGVHLHPK